MADIAGGAGDDFVLATNETHSVREFAETAFARVDLTKEFATTTATSPAEVDLLIGDASKAKVLGWFPKSVSDLVGIMVDAVELLAASRGNNRCCAERRAGRHSGRPSRPGAGAIAGTTATSG